ncbi:outer membrane protein assembly factor BamA precursor [bacterium BMS3Abin07]|nr:outer membrane protein assembly factor BamA precursor [bacterium BMS3Abin07]GBE31248.1 outer membrane protein assembly factor BamA precursor [bacterium BMS3Bbin05]HDO21945.1 outer membrane protein assembly factor BamA [Nitrospirota bacterium]HDZ87862.1 outer membrane protein assembly factor BamA [Nitrospirota bacterium]
MKIDKKFGLFLCLALFLTIITPAVRTGIAADGMIREIRIEGLHRMKKADFLELFGIHVNNRLDKESVRKGIKRVFLTDRFKDIVVMTDDNDPSIVIIRVKEKYIVRDIKVKGLVNLRERDVLKYFSIKSNDYLETSRLEPAVRRLEKKLAGIGYPEAKVSYSINYSDSDHTVLIKLSIKEGQPLIIKKIHIHGIHGEGEVDRALLILKIFTGDVYNRSYIADRLKKLRRRYRDDGYISPAIGPFTFENGVLSIDVALGDLLNVKFKGNAYYTSARLMEETLFSDTESVSNEVIEDSSERILKLYHKSGFVFAQVAPVIKETKGLKEVLFFIYEGVQVEINKINIQGNSIGDKLIKGILSLKEGEYFNPDMIDTDRETLTEFYSALGFREIKINDFKYKYNRSKTEVQLFINLTEGSQTLIGGIYFQGNHIISANEIIGVTNLRPLMPYNEITVYDARYSIMHAYKRRGYLDVTVKIERRFSSNRAYVKFIINEGERYYFGYTIVRGNRYVNSEVITRELLNRKGEPFNLTLLRKNTQRLYKLGLFSNVNYRIIDDSDRSRSVILNVRESDAGTVEFALGYGDYEKMRGYIDISYRNLFGMNRQANVRAELSTLYEKFIIGVFEPWLYRFRGAYSPLSLRLNLIKEQRTEKNIDTGKVKYKVNRYSATGNIGMSFTDKLKGEMLYRYSIVRTSDVQPDIILSRDDTGTLSISSIRPGIIFDSRNNPFNPTKGILAGLSFEIASRYMASETEFTKTVLNVSLYQRIIKRLVIAGSIRGGIADTLGKTTEIPLIERFFLGGRNTVRGYAQDSLGPKGKDGNPIGGKVFLMNNLELRTVLGWNFGLVFFLDGGNVWLDKSDFTLNGYKFTYGTGLRYMTPVGPVRLDYGYKLDREEGESAAEIHFSIGHAF